MSMSFAARRREPEIMDRPDLDPEMHRRALSGLARINAISGSANQMWEVIKPVAAASSRPLRVLDIACGSGDIPISLVRLARNSGIKLAVEGCDISETAIQFAKNRATEADMDIHFFRCDLLEDEIPQGYDVITNSLFMHHLSESQIVSVLSKAANATNDLVVVNDLVRSRLNYCLVWLASRLFSRSPVVHFDGPVSVRAALTQQEFRNLAMHAGLAEVCVRNEFPCRMILMWRKPNAR